MSAPRRSTSPLSALARLKKFFGLAGSRARVEREEELDARRRLILALRRIYHVQLDISKDAADVRELSKLLQAVGLDLRGLGPELKETRQGVGGTVAQMAELAELLRQVLARAPVEPQPTAELVGLLRQVLARSNAEATTAAGAAATARELPGASATARELPGAAATAGEMPGAAVTARDSAAAVAPSREVSGAAAPAREARAPEAATPVSADRTQAAHAGNEERIGRLELEKRGLEERQAELVAALGAERSRAEEGLRELEITRELHDVERQELRRTIAMRDERIEALETALAEFEASRKELGELQTGLKAEMETRLGRYGELERELAASRAQAAELELRRAELERSLGSRGATLAELEQSLKAREAALAEAQGALQHLESSKQSLQGSNGELAEALRSRDVRLSTLELEAAANTAKIGALEAERAELERQHALRVAQVEAGISERVSLLERRIKDEEKRRIELETRATQEMLRLADESHARLVQGDVRLRSTRKEADELRIGLQSRDATIAELQRSLEEQTRVFHELEQRAREKFADASRELRRLSVDIEGTREVLQGGSPQPAPRAPLPGLSPEHAGGQERSPAIGSPSPAGGAAA